MAQLPGGSREVFSRWGRRRGGQEGRRDGCGRGGEEEEEEEEG